MRGKGTKLGEGCPRVRLSQDRMPIFPPHPLGASLACQPKPKPKPGYGGPASFEKSHSKNSRSKKSHSKKVVPKKVAAP